MSTVLGEGGATEQGVVYGFTPQRGAFTRRTWLCPDKDEARDIYEEYVDLGWSVTVTEGVVTKIEAEYGADQGGGGEPPAEVPTETWELMSNMVMKDVMDLDGFTDASISEADYEKLKKYRDQGEEPDSLTNSGAVKMYKLIRARVNGKEVAQAIIRHNVVVSQGYSLAWATTNAGNVLTSLSGEGLPNDLKFILPLTGPVATGGDGIEKYAGWLKMFANVQQSGFDKWIVAQEYRYGIWARALYTILT